MKTIVFEFPKTWLKLQSFNENHGCSHLLWFDMGTWVASTNAKEGKISLVSPPFLPLVKPKSPKAQSEIILKRSQTINCISRNAALMHDNCRCHCRASRHLAHVCIIIYLYEFYWNQCAHSAESHFSIYSDICFNTYTQYYI